MGVAPGGKQSPHQTSSSVGSGIVIARSRGSIVACAGTTIDADTASNNVTGTTAINILDVFLSSDFGEIVVVNLFVFNELSFNICAKHEIAEFKLIGDFFCLF